MKQIDISTPKFPNTFTMVDDEDFEWLHRLNWYAFKNNLKIYAARMIRDDYGKRKISLMHIEIHGAKPGMEIDHKDMDGLNNQKENLRSATRSQNKCNQGKRRRAASSKYVGVCFVQTRCQFIAYINVNKKRKYLGYFNSEEAAAAKRDLAANALHGEFARTRNV